MDTGEGARHRKLWGSMVFGDRDFGGFRCCVEVGFGDGAEAAGNVTRVRDRRKGERRGKLVRRVIVRLGARESVEQ